MFFFLTFAGTPSRVGKFYRVGGHFPLTLSIDDTGSDAGDPALDPDRIQHPSARRDGISLVEGASVPIPIRGVC